MKRALFATVLTLALLGPVSGASSGWRPVAAGKTKGISGLATLPTSGAGRSFLAVHDNKKPDQVRVAAVTVAEGGAVRYEPLAWNGSELPIDLEAVAGVPGAPGEYVAITSKGAAFHLRFDAGKKGVTALKQFALPNAGDKTEFEGLDLRRFGDTLLCVWADRGDAKTPGMLYWATLDFKTFTFGNRFSAPVSVPFPTTETRPISDLRIDDGGTVFVTSSRDPGDEGPFQSALYAVGNFHKSDDDVDFTPNPAPIRLRVFADHKIEALEFVPGPTGGIVFGTDDEDFGGWLLWNDEG